MPCGWQSDGQKPSLTAHRAHRPHAPLAPNNQTCLWAQPRCLSGVSASAQQLRLVSTQHTSYFLELECSGDKPKEARAYHLDPRNTAGGEERNGCYRLERRWPQLWQSQSRGKSALNSGHERPGNTRTSSLTEQLGGDPWEVTCTQTGQDASSVHPTPFPDGALHTKGAEAGAGGPASLQGLGGGGRAKWGRTVPCPLQPRPGRTSAEARSARGHGAHRGL